MSHIIGLECKIKNLDDLDRACQQLDTVEFKWGQTQFKTYGDRLANCLHTIVVKGKPEAYQIGVVQDGEDYALKIDFYMAGKGLEDAVGKGGHKLMQEYSAQVHIRNYKKQGFRKITRKMEDGVLQLIGEK